MNYFSRPGLDYAGSSESLINAICLAYGITEEVLKSKTRVGKIVEARTIAAYHLHRRLKYSSTVTGRMLNRDHATILHLCNKAEDLIDVDKKFKNQINRFI